VREHFVMVQSYWSLLIQELEENLKKESSNVEIFRPELTPGENMEKVFSFFLSSLRNRPIYKVQPKCKTCIWETDLPLSQLLYSPVRIMNTVKFLNQNLTTLTTTYTDRFPPSHSHSGVLKIIISLNMHTTNF